MTVMYYGPYAGVPGMHHIVRYPSIRVMHCGVKFVGKRIGWGYSSAEALPKHRRVCQRCEKYRVKRA